MAPPELVLPEPVLSVLADPPGTPELPAEPVPGDAGVAPDDPELLPEVLPEELPGELVLPVSL